MTTEAACAYALKTRGWTGLAFEALETLAETTRKLQAEVGVLTSQVTKVETDRDLLQIGHDAGCMDESHLLLLQERDVLLAERRRDALDGQAALDEANNEVVRVRAERDAAQLNFDAWKQTAESRELDIEVIAGERDALAKRWTELLGWICLSDVPAELTAGKESDAYVRGLNNCAEQMRELEAQT
jgi:hypothetical protein